MLSPVEIYMQLCRLCLVRDTTNVPIFEEKSDVQQIYLIITTCLPVMVSQYDNLPKKICTECLNKLNMLYQFRNRSINAEKQLMQWLSALETDIKFRDLESAISVHHSTDKLKSETLILKEEESDNSSDTNPVTDMNFESSFCQSDSKDLINGRMQKWTERNFETQPQRGIVGFLQPQIETGGFRQPQVKNGGFQPPQTQVAFVAAPQNCWQSSLQPAENVNRVTAPVGRVQVACGSNQGLFSTTAIQKDESFRHNSTNGSKVEERSSSLQPTTFVSVPATEILSLNVSHQSDPLTLGTTESRDPINGGMQMGNIETKPQKGIWGFQQPQIETGVFQQTQAESRGFQQPQIFIRRYQQPQTQVAYVAGPQNCWQSSFQPAVSINRVTPPHGRVQVAYGSNQGLFNTTTIQKAEDFRFNSTNETKLSVQYSSSLQPTTDTGIVSLNVPNHSDPLTLSTTESRPVAAPAVYSQREQKNVRANSRTDTIASANKDSAKLESQNTCPTCQKEFLNVRRMHYHRMREHTKKTVPCDQCDKLFQSRTLVTVHKRMVHIRDFKHECDICSKKFHGAQALRIHRNVHVKQNPFNCTQCTRSFSTQNSLQEHVRVQHEGVRYICFPCNKSFTKRSYFIEHMKQHNPESSKVFRCKNCPEEFATRGNLRSHNRRHHTSSGYICDTCGKKLTNAVGLRDHTLLHTGEQPFVCETCGKKFVKKQLLKQHMRVHTNEKPYACPECGRKFSQIPSMRRHQRLHTGERPYPCLICDKKFVSRSALKLHSKVHGTALADIKIGRSN